MALQEIRDRFGRLEQKGVSTKAACSEALASGIYTLVGALVITYAGTHASIEHAAVIALAFGLAATVAIYTTAHNSGGQITPAVTVGMVASGITTPIQAVANVVGQVGGAVLAIVFLRMLVPHGVLVGGHLAGPFVPHHSNFLRAFIGEALGAFLIQIVYLETGHHKESRAGNASPLAIGLAYGAAVLALLPVSGAGLSPARALASALLSGHLKHVWLYLFAPVVGALLATPFHLTSITDLDTTLRQAQRAVEERSTEPLLASNNA